MKRHLSVSSELSTESKVKIDPYRVSNNNMGSRAKPPSLHPDNDDLTFQLVEITYREVKQKLQIQIFGVTSNGNSVCCIVNGFSSYFYSTIPNGLQDNSFDDIRTDSHVLAVDIVNRYNLYRYQGVEKKRFLKITVSTLSNLTYVKRKLRELDNEIQFFEADVDPVMRFMVDTKIHGCNWIELPPNTWRKSDPCISFCQIEVNVNYKPDKFISHLWMKIAPLRILSLDIIDQKVQIANIIFNQDQSMPILKKVYVLNGCDPIIGVDVIYFDDEKNMLQAWYDFIRHSDPDIITGYNIYNQDLTKLGRFREVLTNEKNINAIGRVIFDLRSIIESNSNYKLRSYALSAASHYFFDEHKQDFNSKTITDLFSKNAQTRQRLAKYSLENAALSMRLYNEKMRIVNYIEISRISGVTLNTAINKGQQIKVYSQLLRVARRRDYILPLRTESNGKYETNEVYEGMKPKCGYYEDPIAVLDFASMSSNIMITYNLCYSTLLDKDDANEYNVPETNIWCSPRGHKFVNSDVRKGLFPEILENLLNERKTVKQAFESEQDLNMKTILNDRQLAIKLLANAVYGFTGAKIGKTLPCFEVANSIIDYGRKMICDAQEDIESFYTRKNQFEEDAHIVYRDTDSVMVRFHVKTIEKCIELGQNAAMRLSSIFSGTITLEFEKVYCPLILISTNHYAGLKYTQPNSHDGIESKGIETVCRNTIPFVADSMKICLEKLLIDENYESAVNYAKQIISNLLCNRIDISQLIITKELAKTKNVNKQAHVELAKKMKERDTHTAPKLGDRVQYVICRAADKTPAYNKAEDPLYALENRVPIDLKYYLDNQLIKPLQRIFEPVLGHKVKSTLLSEQHIPTQTIGPMDKYRIKTCLGCSGPLQTNNNLLCSRCKQRPQAVYLKELEVQQKLEENFSKLSAECQRCQGSLHQEILCTNNICPIFYMRKKCQIDLGVQEERMQPLKDLGW